MKVLYVDDAITERVVMTSHLKRLGHEVICGDNGQQAVELYRHHRPDLVLLDVMMPLMDGYQSARLIRAFNDEWVPIIFLSGRIHADAVATGIEAGGDDYLAKPVDRKILTAKMQALERIAAMRRRLVTVSAALEKANVKLQELVNADGLTGLPNRRRLDQHIAREAARCARYRQPLSVVMADLDHFKAYNDRYGHLCGDDCLKKVAKALQAEARRPSDLVARYGGEEFCVILPDTPLEGALHVAERLRAAVEALSMADASRSPGGLVTLSLGVATHVPGPEFNTERLLREADRALYRAKRSGRNRVCSPQKLS